jgi:hypothetical protein
MTITNYEIAREYLRRGWARQVVQGASTEELPVGHLKGDLLTFLEVRGAEATVRRAEAYMADLERVMGNPAMPYVVKRTLMAQFRTCETVAAMLTAE